MEGRMFAGNNQFAHFRRNGRWEYQELFETIGVAKTYYIQNVFNLGYFAHFDFVIDVLVCFNSYAYYQ